MRESNKYPEIILYKNYLYSNDIVDGDYIDRLLLKMEAFIDKINTFKSDFIPLVENKCISKNEIERLLKRYPYIKVAHRFFDKNIYIYSKG